MRSPPSFTREQRPAVCDPWLVVAWSERVASTGAATLEPPNTKPTVASVPNGRIVALQLFRACPAVNSK